MNFLSAGIPVTIVEMALALFFCLLVAIGTAGLAP